MQQVRAGLLFAFMGVAFPSLMTGQDAVDDNPFFVTYRKPKVIAAQPAVAPVQEAAAHQKAMWTAGKETVASQLNKVDAPFRLVPRNRTELRPQAQGGAAAAAETMTRIGKKHVSTWGLTVGEPIAGAAAEVSSEAGVPLSYHTSVMTMHSADGKVILTRERQIPKTIGDLKETVDPASALRMVYADARAAIAERLASEPANRRRQWRELLLTAEKPNLEVWVDSKQIGHLTWRCQVQSLEAGFPFAYWYWVAATEKPEILHKESRVAEGHEGTARGQVWLQSSQDPTADAPLPHLSILRTVPGTPGEDEVYTNESGSYSFQNGQGQVTIRGRLRGRHCVIFDGTGNYISPSQMGTTGAPINITFSPATEQHRAQVTAFRWVSYGHSVVESILGENVYPNLETHVNLTGQCNAYSYGSKLEFYGASPQGCLNTAYSDIVAHEFGHSIDFYFGGMENPGLSEGIGDAFAILLTRQPIVGRNWFVRDARVAIHYPPTGGVHNQGRVLAGFTWDLVTQLRATLNEDDAYNAALEIILGAVALEPSGFQETIRDCFLAVDDDADLSNGVPKYGKEIWKAAKARAIPRPAEMPDPS